MRGARDPKLDQGPYSKKRHRRYRGTETK